MLDFMHNLYLESDYMEQYEKLGIGLWHETRFAHVAKDHELIEGYQVLADTEQVIKSPYYDVFDQKILFVNVLIQHVNVLDNYVELVVLINWKGG